MCGPKSCPMHNFRDADWEEIPTIVAERKREQLTWVQEPRPLSHAATGSA